MFHSFPSLSKFSVHQFSFSKLLLSYWPLRINCQLTFGGECYLMYWSKLSLDQQNWDLVTVQAIAYSLHPFHSHKILEWALMHYPWGYCHPRRDHCPQVFPVICHPLVCRCVFPTGCFDATFPSLSEYITAVHWQLCWWNPLSDFKAVGKCYASIVMENYIAYFQQNFFCYE